jgi:glycosyltransferase involved in cell wall biosynthesis
MSEASNASTVIVGHVNFTPMIFGLLARNSRLQVLLTIFGIDVWSKLSKFQRMGLSKVDRILSISKSTRDKMAAANNLNGTPVNILPCTIEPFYGQNVALISREGLCLPEGKMMLSTSRLDASEQYKRIEDVIAAMPAVLERVPDAFYVIVGDGTDRKRLEDLSEQAGVKERVFFPGYVQDEPLCSYYNACDIFVLPSTREGFGIVFLEAMYYGKPCVGARAGATPEVIEDGVTGLLSDPENPKQLADAITRILQDEQLKVSMGDASRERLNQQFSFPLFAQRLESALTDSNR